MPQVPAVPTLTDEGGLGLDLEAPPPPATYTQVTSESSGIVGKPCVWLHLGAVVWEFGWRITSLPWVSESTGEWGISLCPEAEWWAAAYAGRKPEQGLRHLRASRVWLVG